VGGGKDARNVTLFTFPQPPIPVRSLSYTCSINEKILTMYMTYFIIKTRAVGEFSPDEWWEKC
jgi:hypothetical protein